MMRGFLDFSYSLGPRLDFVSPTLPVHQVLNSIKGEHVCMCDCIPQYFLLSGETNDKFGI